MKINDVIYVDTRDDRRTIYEILRYVDRGIIYIDRNDLTWDCTQQSEFIENCLMRIPTQPFYFHEQRDGKYKVMDGTQRIISLDRFRKNELILSGLTINPNLNGWNFESISDKYKNIFDDFQIRFHNFSPSTSKNIIDEFIRRINKIY